MALQALFVEPFISQLIEKLNLPSRALSLIPYGGADAKLRKQWQKTLLIFQGALPNAEERALSNDLEEASVQQWVHDVQNLAYEIDDFHDRLDFKARHRQVMDEPESSRPSKIVKLFSVFSFSNITSSITHTNDENWKIDDIANRLQELVNKMNTLGLDGREPVRRRDVRLQSTAFKDPNLVFGRKDEIDAILSLLLHDRMLGDHIGKLRVISIVGMPGIGKTTLAQCLYHNWEVRDRFPYRAWVSVPEDFDVLHISQTIYEGVYRKKCPYISNLNMVHQELVEKLYNKKFLLVLDGVWNESGEKWDLLCNVFRARPFETVIIVTTRSRIIAKSVRSEKVFDVNVLSDGDCLSLLAQQALQTPNFNEHQYLKEVGEVIARRCKGSPLVAKLLGDLLHNRGTSSKHWIEVSTSKIWELLSNDIKYDLSRSYHHLPRHLKPLFVYCSILPKGYEFDKQELVMLWMAQGFLGPSGVETQMDELGCEYFDQLKFRSFFPCLTGESSFMMDDLTSDLAQNVAGVMCLCLEDKMVKHEEYKVADEARHASFNYNKYFGLNKFKVFNEVPGLRTLLLIQEKTRLSFLSSKILNDLLPRLQCLRSLSFGGCRISEIPESLADLKLLRHLDFSRTDITVVPEFVSHLYNLQTILLHGCSKLVRLPTSIRNLIDLRHLNIVDTPSLEEMPSGIGMLTYLHTLSKFIVDKSYGRKITELKGLHHLKGTLAIMGMENVMRVQDAIEANLLIKEGLQGLKMKWSSCSNGGTQGRQPEFKVLDALKPQKDIESLEIEFYGGLIFPTWIGDHLFDKMVKVRLNGCKNVKKLPSLGELSSLKELFIEGMNGVKTVGEEFFGTDAPHAEAFPSLVVLSFTDMNGWEEWFANFNGAFPCLQELQMSGCLTLNTVSLPSIPSLGTLKLHGCSRTVLTGMVEQLGSVKNLELRNISRLSVLDEEIIWCLGEVQDLSVYECEEMRYFWREEVACRVLEKIKSLTVKGCQLLESMGVKEQPLLPHNLESLEVENCNNLEKMPNWQNNQISLRRLTIKDCKKLQNFPSTTYFQTNAEYYETISRGQEATQVYWGEYEFSNLESVSVHGCPCLRSFPTGKKLPRTLRGLSIGDCNNMAEPEEGDTCMSLRESNCFESWLNLKHLPEGLANVTRLVINSCQSLESIPERSLSPTLVSLVITNCSNLKNILCHNEMQNLKSLRELTIIGCKNLELYPCGGGWPPNLESLIMGDVKHPIERWGLARLPTSLRTLGFDGDFPELVSFGVVGSIVHTTTSLTSLQIKSMKDLKSLGKGFENLSSLKHLLIASCPSLLELPETLLFTLSSLEIDDCPGLKKRCSKKGKRDYWPKISHIPCLKIDGDLIWGL